MGKNNKSNGLKIGDKIKTDNIDGIVTEIKHYGKYLKLISEFLEDDELIDDNLTIRELLEILKQRM